jgi:hypothetical protein
MHGQQNIKKNHNHVLTSERILIIIVKFDYEPANLQHKLYKWVLLKYVYYLERRSS